MNSSSLRRLASDHASLHRHGLPPHYLFPLQNGIAPTDIPDDLTQLTVLLTGPRGTPYSNGVWILHLKMPHDYPKRPPTASFRTRIWHPNVEEGSGSVCVDTLKRDWDSKLKLRDVLVTISCLLIQPNPDSALNSAAGSLLQEDYEEFARQAKLMTSIHAPIPSELKDAVLEAKNRGEEEEGMKVQDAAADDVKLKRPTMANKASSNSSTVIMKKKPQNSSTSIPHVDTGSAPEETDLNDPAQENNPLLSPTPTPDVAQVTSPRRSTLGKRPLSVLATPIDPDATEDTANTDHNNMTPSEKNIAANSTPGSSHNRDTDTDPDLPLRKSPRLTDLGIEVNMSGRIRLDLPDLSSSSFAPSTKATLIHEDEDARQIESPRQSTAEEKENLSSSRTTTLVTSRGRGNSINSGNTGLGATKVGSVISVKKGGKDALGMRKVSATGNGAAKPRVKIGVRRL